MGPGDGPLPGIVMVGGLTMAGCAVGCTNVGGGADEGDGKRIRGGVTWPKPARLDSNSHAVAIPANRIRRPTDTCGFTSREK
jgi:hypothetical protein